MRKFSKILFLLLALVAMVSAFALTALAAEETELAPALTKQLDLEEYEADAVFNNSAAKKGAWIIGEADNGNKYVISKYEDATGTAYDNWDPVTGSTPTTHNLQNYPSFALDWDVMSTTGAYTGVSVRPDLYGVSHEGHRLTQGSTTYFYEIGLPTAANVWSHVTFICRHEGDGVFGYYFYVDGEMTYSKSVDYNTTAFSASDTKTQELGITNWDDLLDENGELAYNNIRVRVVSFYPTYSSTEEVSFDNFQFSFYPESYTNEDIAAYVYNDSYEMPYGQTEAIVNDTVYDDVDEAFEALKDGDKLTLKTDLDGITVINKAVTIDTNKYDENGDPAGECYAATFKSTEGYVITEEGGVYTVTKSDKNVTVVFDPECADETCTCYGEGVGHKQTYSVVVPVGVVPEFLPEIQVINNEGLVAEFLGWSYTKGGAAEELTAVTAEQAEAGTLNIYPVYNVTQYDFGCVDANGDYTFYSADEFETALATAIANPGTVITLYSDIVYYKGFTFTANTNVTIDLNGHTLTRINLYGAVQNYNASTGAYEDGTATETVKNAFSASNVKYTFTMTSSKEGAEFRTFTVNGTAYYDADGKLERYDVTSMAGAGLISSTQTKNGSSFNLENLTVYSLNIFYGSHNSGSKTHYVNVTNCNFYRTTAGTSTDGGWGYDCIYTAGDARVTIKDSLFYFPSSSVFSKNVIFIRLQAGSSTASAVIDNCDIISDYASVGITQDLDGHNVTVTNSRIYNIVNNSAARPINFGNDVICTAGKNSNLVNRIALADGVVIVDNSQSFTYSLPTSSKVTYDSDTGEFVYDFAFADRDIAFTKETKLYTEVYSKVTWLDENGEVIETTDEFKNATATPPVVKVPAGDGYRAFTNPNWLDANNEISDLAIAELDAYTFTLSTVLPENPEYVAYVTEVLFNMSYYGHFGYNLYVPVADGIEVTYLGSYDSTSGNFGTTKVGGKDYYVCNSGWPGPGSLIKNVTGQIKFTADGVSYETSVTINALIYAELLLTDKSATDIEKDAVLKLIAYAEEVYEYVYEPTTDADGNEIAFADSENGLKFSTFFTDYNSGNRPTYITDYSNETVYDIDETFESTVEATINFGIHSNSRMTFFVTLSADSVAAGYTLKLTGTSSFVSTTISNDDGSVTYYTNNAKLVNSIMASKYVITVYDSTGTAVASTNYNLATYCASVNSDLMNSFYTFGKAAGEVRKYLETL